MAIYDPTPDAEDAALDAIFGTDDDDLSEDTTDESPPKPKLRDPEVRKTPRIISAEGIDLAAKKKPYRDEIDRLEGEAQPLRELLKAGETQQPRPVEMEGWQAKLTKLQERIEHNTQLETFVGVSQEEILDTHLGLPAQAELEKANKALEEAKRDFPPAYAGAETSANVDLAQARVDELRTAMRRAQNEANRRYSEVKADEIRHGKAVTAAQEEAAKRDAAYIEGLKQDGVPEWDIKAAEAKQAQPFAERHAKDWAELVSTARADIDARAAGPDAWINHRFGEGAILHPADVMVLRQRGETALADAVQQSGRVGEQGVPGATAEASEGGEAGEGGGEGGE